MIRDAAEEGLRDVWVLVLGVWVLLLAALPAVAGMGVAVQQRATLDGGLGGLWLLAIGVALRLGTTLPGGGLRALVLPAVGEWRWLLARGFAFSVILAGAVVGGLSLLSLLAPIRGAGIGWWIHGVCCVAEALVWMWGAALLVQWTRPWLAALCVAGLGLVGHLERNVIDALGMWGLEDVGAVVMLGLPSFEATDVQGLVVTGVSVDAIPVGMGIGQLLCWSLLLAGATGMTMARRDRLP